VANRMHCDWFMKCSNRFNYDVSVLSHYDFLVKSIPSRCLSGSIGPPEEEGGGRVDTKLIVECECRISFKIVSFSFQSI
jgi:hypothetical protein